MTRYPNVRAALASNLATQGAPDAQASSEGTPKKKSRARKTSTKPTRIYSWRVLPPEDPAHRKLVDEQFWLAHQYRCRLIEIEIELRGRFRDIDLDHPLTREAYYLWEAQSNTLDNAYADLRAAKSGCAPEHRDDERIRQFIKEWKSECVRAWSAVKAARIHPEVAAHHQASYAAVRKAAHTQRLAARAEFSAKGLMHGTYIRIERAVEQSVDSTGRPPEFERYEGEGSVGHQLPRRRNKKGLHSVTARDLYAGLNTHVRMTELPEAWERLPRTARRRIAKPYRGVAKRQPHASMCLGPVVVGWQEIPARLDGQYIEMQFGWEPAKRPSTWIRFPLTHHRRMPKDAEVLWVYVHRWRVSLHYEWRVQLTIESETFHRPAEPKAHGGTCAIDIGWRRILDADGNQIGLRVAYLVDEYGQEREIRAPDGLWQRLAKVYSIAQTRSKELDKIRDQLTAWSDSRQMPKWFAEDHQIVCPLTPCEGICRRCGGVGWVYSNLTVGLRQWRASRKMQRLIDFWKKEENRFAEDSEMLTALLAWAKHDRHLASWEAHMRDRTIAHRREVWREEAAKLARTYSTILVEDGLCRSEGREQQMKIVDIEGWDRPAPEEGDPHEGREQRRQSRMAAPGELRLAIAHASHKTASTVIDVARTKNSTRECAWCCHVQKHADFAASIEIQCENENCRRTWDQDANAARNLLQRHGLTSGPVPPPVKASGPVPPSSRKALASGKGAKQHQVAARIGRRDAKRRSE